MSANSPTESDRQRVVDLESGLDAFRSSEEFRGPIESLDGHDSNDHLALVHESRREQFDAAIPFMEQGLDRGERCLYVADENSKETVLAEMRERGVDVDDALDTGALTVHTKQDTYCRNGTFEPDDMIDFVAGAIDEALESYEALRITGEMTWVFGDDPDIEDLVEYEAKLNDLLPEEDCIALCQYNRERFPPEVLRDVVRTHPHLVYDDTVCHNFYYTPPEEFFGPERPARQVDRMMETLLERTEAKSELQERTRYLRRQNEITADDRSFEEKIADLLELGCDRFDLDIGLLSHVTGESFDIVEAVGSHDLIDSGLRSDLSETYCREVLDSDGPVCVDDVPANDRIGREAYETYGLDSYLGTQVTIGDEEYGTLCFASERRRGRPFSEAERTFLELAGQWVSYELEREHRQAQLAGLNEMGRDLMTAETHEEVAGLAVEHAEETLRLPLTALVTYDQRSGDLEPIAQTPRSEDELPTTALCEPQSGALWDVFVANETRLLGDVAAVPGAADDVTQLIAIPLGRQGLFVTATKGADGFSTGERDFVEATASTIRSALTRADREQALQERERRLEDQNETLTRLNRVNETIRSIGQGLVKASTRDEIEAVVCEELAAAGPYELAWIGEHDSVTDEITPRQWAGSEKGYLDAAVITADDTPTGRGPGGEAVRTHEPQVVDNVLNEPQFEPWRQSALDRGFHAAIALPLEYEGCLYGVLVVYADQPGVFDDLERSVMTELGDTIAYAINAVESKKALVSDDVAELEFVVEDDGLEIVELARATGCEFGLESVVPQPDGRLRAFVSTRGVAAADVLDFAPRLAASDLTLLSEYDDDDGPVCLFEATLDDGSLCETVREHGGRPTAITTAADSATVRVELAADADVRQFVETFERNYPDSELVAQRTRERPRRTSTEFRAALTEDLTDRQLEVLQTAYFSGYFEKPRSQTGSEVATTLDISQPTFNAHVRAALRRLCRQLFETDATGR